MLNSFSKILIVYRRENNLTQSDMANFLCKRECVLLNLDVVTISRWERGKTIPSMEKRMLILSLIGKIDEYFYQEAEKIKLTNSNQIDRVLTKRYTPSIEQSISLRIKE